MKKLTQVLLLLFTATQFSYAQKVQATVASGPHLILATNWGVFANSIISVEQLDGANKHFYRQPPFNYNVNAMYVPGLDSDFAQNTPVRVYIVKPLIKVISAPIITGTVGSTNHLIASVDWSKFSTNKILVEDADGRNQHIYSTVSTRPYNPDAMLVLNLDADFPDGSIVNVYNIDKAMLHYEGNVSINTTNFDYPFSVNGKILAKEIKVEASSWPDYVFIKDYPLSTLQETEKHIKEKGHLPGIPSAAEVKANGIDLGEMNAKLLQKIEELTLHLIEQNKILRAQQNKLDVQQEEIKALKLDRK
jgi:hypothetical protein